MFMKKLFNIIKTIFWTFWSFITGLFRNKNQNKTISLKKSENDKEEQTKIKIVDNSGYAFEEANKSPQELIITNEQVKEIIREKYQENLKNNYFNNKDIPTVIENKILTQVKNEVQKEEITTIDNLESIIEEQVKVNTENPDNIEVKPYKKKTPLKDNFVVLYNDNTYALTDKFDNILSARFKAPIVDYIGNYLKIFYDNKYYVYDFKGNILTKDGFKDIRLFEEFYAVINDDYTLDVREYNDPNFKLSSPILLDKMVYQTDYEIKKYISEYKIKVKSRNEVYHADTKGIIQESKNEVYKINHEPVIANISNLTLEKPVINNDDIIYDRVELEDKNDSKMPVLTENIPNKYTSPEEDYENEFISNSKINEVPSSNESINLTQNNDNNVLNNRSIDEKNNATLSNEQVKDECTPEIMKLEASIESDINIVSNNYNVEANKEELEDKNYEALDQELNQILDIIALKKKQTKNPEDLKKLNNLELKALTLKNNIENKKNADIIREKEYLESEIHTSDLYSLQTEIKNVHLNNAESLREYSLQNIEDLNLLNEQDAKKLEKELLKMELKKAGRVAKISNVLNLFPFVRNRYFKFFASGMLVKTHLKIYENILKRKNIQYRESNFNNMVNGHTALNGALSLTVRNINRLTALEEATKNKFPDIASDQEYIASVSDLKNALLSEEEKMLKKKTVVNKYNLYQGSRVRELKKVI